MQPPTALATAATAEHRVLAPLGAKYLPTLQARRKWTEVRRNLQEGEVVLLLDPNVPRGPWPMARVEKTYPGQDGLVRVVDVKTSKGLFKRPVTKIVRLEMDQ